MPLPQKYNIYHEYKYSGINWLGAIPKRWSLKPIKYATYINPKVLSEKTNADQEINYIDISSVNCNGIINNIQKLKFSDAPSRARRIVDSGDTIVSTVRTYLRAIAFIDKRKDGFICSTGFAVLKPRKFLHAKYLAYYVMSTQFVDNIVANSVGVSYPAISSSDVGSMPIILPSFKEQQKISAFLDRETSKLDRLIEKKERLIELLKEKRQAIITQAVTKGLDPKVPMKDSGIEWLGELPEHWRFLKLKFLTKKIIDGTHFTPKYVDEGIPFLRVTNIVSANNSGINLNEVKYITPEEHRLLSKRCRPEKGDLLLTKNGTIGVPRVVDWDFEFSIFVSLCLIKFNNQMSPYFASLFFKSDVIKRQIKIGSKTNTVTNLHIDKICEFYFPVPTFEEQNEIVKYLNKVVAKSDSVMSKIEKQITKIKEYRQALISAAVTGKIDVRDEV